MQKNKKVITFFPDRYDDNANWLAIGRVANQKQIVIKRITIKLGIQIMGTVIFTNSTFNYQTNFNLLKDFLSQQKGNILIDGKVTKINIKNSNQLILSLISQGYKVTEYED